MGDGSSFLARLGEQMASPATDDLVQRARTGESAALEFLWHEHRRWLAVVLLAHMPHESEVEDLLQEVAVKMVEKIHELEDPAKLRPWLRSVALHTAHSAGRKASLRRRILRRLNPLHHRIADAQAQKDEQALAARIAAKIDLLTWRINQAKIVAPITGVVTAGDWRRRLGAPIETGQQL